MVNMAATLRRIGTIESDEEVEVCEESDDENTTVAPKKSKSKDKAKKKGFFNKEFEFADENGSNEISWKMHKFIQDSAKGLTSSQSLEDKITRKREMKNAKSNDEFGSIVDADGLNSAVMVKEQESKEVDSIALPEDFNDDEHSEEEEDEEDEEDDDSFFDRPPPQVALENFAKLNLSRPILRAVNELGFQQPTPIQCSTIPVALLGKDICACAATGTGKTASFMLPILERLLFRPKQVPVSRVLVLVPTRELAVQVHSVSRALAKFLDLQICLVAELEASGLENKALKKEACCDSKAIDLERMKGTDVVLEKLSGGLKMKEQEAALRKEPDIIIATPGRLVDHLHNTPSFGLQNIEILVLDEADRMLEEHFEEQMKEIIKECQMGRQTMLFSATMTDKVEELVSLSLNHPVRIFIDQNTDVASCLQQEFVRIRSNREHDRLAIVTALCCRNFNSHCLVFCQTKKLAHYLRIVLGLFGLKSGELHGDLNQVQRLEALDSFKNGKVDILVATDLAARGLDISGVMTVISFNMPTSFKSYIHRVGRTARAGKFGRSITLVGEKERKNLKLACKTSTVPVKHRIVSPDVIDMFKRKIKDLEKDIADILKEEEEDKQFRISEMEMNKAKNMVVHQKEIMSRPPKSWIKKEKEPKGAGGKKEVKSLKRSSEEVQLSKEQEYLKRTMKREKKPKRLRACDETENLKNAERGKVKKKKTEKQNTGFEKELTDSSKKALRDFRSRPTLGKSKKKAGNFNSKKKFKRR